MNTKEKNIEKNYIVHLVECQCTLPLFKNKTKPVYHKFKVFSIINEESSLESKYVICDNCSAVHEVSEVQKSNILWGQEGYKSLVKSIEDITFNLESEGMSNVVGILASNKCDITVWEQIEHIYENNLEGHTCLIKKEDIKDYFLIKYFLFEKGKFKLKTEKVRKWYDI